LHEEPVSQAARQWLAAAEGLPVTMYTAQNVDKRFPPPFAQFETAAYRRVQALYPCSRQAASVARGKGFDGIIDVLPLGIDNLYSPGEQSAADDETRLGIVGRLVPEKGVSDAIRVLAHVRARRRARLLVIGSGPEEGTARSLARNLGVADAVEFVAWQPLTGLAELYRSLHVVLVPSRATETWVEQFGRIILEGQASGAVVAGYRSGAIPEVAGDSAILVEEGAVDRLAVGVEALLDSAERFSHLRQAGLTRTREMTWGAVAEGQADLYERVASLGGTPGPRVTATATRRHRARQEFGVPARLLGGYRPFALPLLRRNLAWTRAAGRATDTMTTLAQLARRAVITQPSDARPPSER
jgi:glycosyltransferase involved in cell wall biosynthesis